MLCLSSLCFHSFQNIDQNSKLIHSSVVHRFGPILVSYPMVGLKNRQLVYSTVRKIKMFFKTIFFIFVYIYYFSFWVHFILILNCKLFGSSVHRHDIDQKMKFEFIVWQNWYWCNVHLKPSLKYFLQNFPSLDEVPTLTLMWTVLLIICFIIFLSISWGKTPKKEKLFWDICTPKNGGSPREKVHRCQTDGSSLNQKSFFFWESTLNDVLWGKRLNNIFSVLSFCSNSRR